MKIPENPTCPNCSGVGDNQYPFGCCSDECVLERIQDEAIAKFHKEIKARGIANAENADILAAVICNELTEEHDLTKDEWLKVLYTLCDASKEAFPGQYKDYTKKRS